MLVLLRREGEGVDRGGGGVWQAVRMCMCGEHEHLFCVTTMHTSLHTTLHTVTLFHRLPHH